MKPGIYKFTAEQYHADPAPTASLSSSIAKILLDQTPQHAWMAHPRLNLQYEKREAPAFDLGSAAHMLLLEGREDRIVRVQADDWRTKAAKEERDNARANGQFPVLERQFGDMQNMVTVAKAYMDSTELCDIFRNAIADETTEQTVLWQERNLWYRCRPDLMSADGKIVLDYKSTASAQPDFVARQIARMGYDTQACFYKRGIKAVTDIDPAFVFLFQEVEEPYACSLIGMSNAYIELGASKVNRAVNIWEKCVVENNFPGYSNKIMYAEPKDWDLTQEEVLAAGEQV
jgi:hypothetical protein